MTSLLLSRLFKRRSSPLSAYSGSGLPSPDALHRSPTATARLRRIEEDWSTRSIGSGAAVAALLLLLACSAMLVSRHFGALAWAATVNVARDDAPHGVGESVASARSTLAATSGLDGSAAGGGGGGLCRAPAHCIHPHRTICRRAARIATAQVEGAAAARLEDLRCVKDAAERLAVIVPLRNRTAHARRFQREFGAQLARWDVNATIFMVEQTADGFFNVCW